MTCPSVHEAPAKGTTDQDIADQVASGGHLSYIYVGKGLTTAATRPDSVLMYEPPRNHVRDRPGLHVLYADERVEYLQGDTATQFWLTMRER